MLRWARGATLGRGKRWTAKIPSEFVEKRWIAWRPREPDVGSGWPVGRGFVAGLAVSSNGCVLEPAFGLPRYGAVVRVMPVTGYPRGRREGRRRALQGASALCLVLRFRPAATFF